MPAVMPATKAKMTREKANGINGSFEGHMYRKASDVLGRVHRYACILRRGSCSALQCLIVLTSSSTDVHRYSRRRN